MNDIKIKKDRIKTYGTKTYPEYARKSTIERDS